MTRTGPVDLKAIRERNVYAAGMETGSTNARLDALGEKITDLSKSVDKRFEQVDKRFEQVDKRFEQVDEEFKAVRAEMSAGFDRLFWKLIGTGLSIATVAFALAESL